MTRREAPYLTPDVIVQNLTVTSIRGGAIPEFSVCWQHEWIGGVTLYLPSAKNEVWIEHFYPLQDWNHAKHGNPKKQGIGTLVNAYVAASLAVPDSSQLLVVEPTDAVAEQFYESIGIPRAYPRPSFMGGASVGVYRAKSLERALARFPITAEQLNLGRRE